jgi:crotonobetainyl-CoA:carnitine CoA-transferase CaiB-like acyl-CoA transferase
VYASISGFGRGGPYESWPGLDQIAQGMSGLMSITGSAESGPFRVGLPIADLSAGMWAAIGVLAALLHQRATGRGQRVETSLLSGLVGMLCVQGQRYLSLGEVPEPAGNDHPVLAPYGAFSTANGLLNIGVATERMWRTLCRILETDDLAEHPDYRDNEARMRNRDTLRQRLEERLRRRTKEEWAKLCIEAGIPAGPIMRVDETLQDPHVLATRCVETVDHPIFGPLRQLASPVRLGAHSGISCRTPPPMLGAHTVDVLRSFGFAESEIERLLDSGILVKDGGGGGTKERR